MTIKEIRIGLGLTQEQFAETLGVKQTTVSGWESGYRTPSIKMLKHISYVHKIPLAELLAA